MSDDTVTPIMTREELARATESFLASWAALLNARVPWWDEFAAAVRALVEHAYAAGAHAERIRDEDRRTDDDKAVARAIMDATDSVKMTRLLFDYYRDLGRAERTPRVTMYLHMGLLTGAVLAMGEAVRRAARAKNQ